MEAKTKTTTFFRRGYYAIILFCRVSYGRQNLIGAFVLTLTILLEYWLIYIYLYIF